MLGHPQIAPPGRRPPTGRWLEAVRATKELHFFNEFRVREMLAEDVAAYHELFPREEGQVVGEWTPRYMRDFWTPRLLHRAAPDARLLVLVRDPLERFRSGVVHTLRAAPEQGREVVATDAIDRGRYATQLMRLRSYFPDERILVLQYERCRSDPLTEYRRMLRFLGVADDHEPDFGRTLGRPTELEKEEVAPGLVEAIQSTLEPEVRQLCALVPEIDLSLWPSFEYLADGHDRARPPGGATSTSAPRTRTGRGGRAAPPDFVGVGAPGCQAEWWHGRLLEHPAIQAPRGRRGALHFFDEFCTRDMNDADVAAYHELFERPAGAIGGEWTARYMHDAWTPALLRRAAPEARLLVMVSDPIERYRFRLPRTLPVDETEPALDPAGPGRYASQLAPLFELFGGDRILVLQTERCIADPLGEYGRTVRFLGVADDFRPRRLRKQAEPYTPPVEGRWQPWLRRLARRPVAAQPRDPWPDLLESLHRDLDPEVEALAAMVPELDLSLWPNFAHLARGARIRPSASLQPPGASSRPAPLA
jgi:hypothetical protein